jgi:restriction system protein
MTIVECIRQILEHSKVPLSVGHIFDEIVKKNLYSFNAKDPKTIVRQQLRRHCAGLSFPSAMPNKYFKQIAKDTYALLSSGKPDPIVPVPVDRKDKLAEENLQDYHIKHVADIKKDLLDRVLNVDPRFFEQLVLDLLLKMGYGTNGSVARRSDGPDGGIDGEILQDKLGFDRIYTQAKRYALSRPVGEPEVREFVGALQSVSKGVFITTSRFTDKARAYVANQQQKKLVLIDGEHLASLMIEFELGVQKTHIYPTFRVDSDYLGEF